MKRSSVLTVLFAIALVLAACGDGSMPTGATMKSPSAPATTATEPEVT